MAWSEAARRASAEVRRRHTKGQNKFRNKTRVSGSFSDRQKHQLVKKATNYRGDSRKQGSAVKALAAEGYHPKTGKFVGKRRAGAVARRIGDYANE